MQACMRVRVHVRVVRARAESCPMGTGWQCDHGGTRISCCGVRGTPGARLDCQTCGPDLVVRLSPPRMLR